MKPYIVVLYWRSFQWSLRAWAKHPQDLFGLHRDAFGDEHVAMKVSPLLGEAT